MTAGRVRWSAVAELTADRKQKERKKTHPSRAYVPVRALTISPL